MSTRTIAQIMTVTYTNTIYVGSKHPLLRTQLASLGLKERRSEYGEKKKKLIVRKYVWNTITGQERAEGIRYLQDKEPIRSVVEDLRLKAYYRMVLALFKCGGGAMRTALDVICNAMEEEFMTEEDKEEFSQLELVIFQHIQELCTKESKIRELATERRSVPAMNGLLNTGNGGSDGFQTVPDRQDFEDCGIQAMMACRNTMIPREVYPWDKFTLTAGSSSCDDKVIKAEIQKDTEVCKVSLELSTDNRSPGIALLANDDIRIGTSILNDTSPFYVTSQNYEKVDETIFCEVCGTQLIASEKYSGSPASDTLRLLKSSSFSTASSTSSSGDSKGYVKVSPLTVQSPSVIEQGRFSENTKTMAPEDSPMDQLPKTPESLTGDFQHVKIGSITPEFSSPHSANPTDPVFPRTSEECRTCYRCAEALYCGDGCYILSSELSHTKICDLTPAIPDLIRYNLYGREFPGIPDLKERKLQSLMLLKLLTYLSNSPKNPLLTPWVRWKLNGELDNPRQIPTGRGPAFDSTPPETSDLFLHFGTAFGEHSKDANDSGRRHAPALIHWSFQANVVFPLHALRSIGGLSLATDVNRFDGWTLNTLIAKIDGSMAVTRHIRRYKTYVGRTMSSCGLYGDSKVKDNSLAGDSVWVGSLHPTCSLIPIADPAKGQVPNVTIVEHGRSKSVIAGTDVNAAKNAVLGTVTSPSSSPMSPAGQNTATPLASSDSDSSSPFFSIPLQKVPEIAVPAGEALYRAADLVSVSPPMELDCQSFLDFVETDLMSNADDSMYSTCSDGDAGSRDAPMDLD